MNRRIAAWICAVAVTVTVMASSLVMSATAESTATLTVASAWGRSGDTVEVPVSISSDSYLVNADIYITYDPAKLQLNAAYYAGDDGETTCYTASSVLNGQWMYYGEEIMPGKFLFSAATGDDIGITAGGELFRLAFTILSDNADGTQITVTADPICGNDGNTPIGPDGYTVDYLISYQAVSGTVRIGSAPGDLTGDGVIDMFDALMLYSYVSGQQSLTPKQQASADYNQNGVIDMFDALALYGRVSGA